MSFINERFHVGGMTCVNCQNKIEKKLLGTAGITKAAVSYQKGTAEITYDTGAISRKQIIAIIEKLDYEVLTEEENQTDIGRMVCILVIIVSLYVILQQLGILNLLVPSRLAGTGMGYGMLFLVGLLTSVHCIAMCGGISLTQCLPVKKTTDRESGASAFRPALLYNLGRVISYTVIGFLLGFAGMVIGGVLGSGVSVLLQGCLKLIAGVFMVIMGMNMLGIFPWLRRLNLSMPKFLAVRVGKQKERSVQPLVVGLLNGLMPCGPLQSMQIVAFASGNPFAGALSMLLFSLGTVPLMLGLGSVVAALGKRFAQKVMSVGAVLVVVLGLAMLSQGGSLSGVLLPERLLILIVALCILGVIASIPYRKTWYKTISLCAAAAVMMAGSTVWRFMSEQNNQEQAMLSAADVIIEDGVQIVNSTLEPGSYPNITVAAGIPVKWVIDAPEGSINGCNYKMLLEAFGMEHVFGTGENVIEFTPEKTGSYGYTCWMGMIHGNIYVIDENGTEALVQEEPANSNLRSSCCGW